MSYTTIWKYELAIQDVQTFSMPRNAKILTVQTQYNTGVLWAEVDPSALRETRKFIIVGTGNPFPPNTEDRKYIGTFQTHHGSLVWHVYETA